MKEEPSRSQERQGLRRDEPPLRPIEAVTVVAARWFQLSAIFWLSLLSPLFCPKLPPLACDGIYWFSWLAMAGGTFALITIAYRHPAFRSGVIHTVVLLWLLLAITLAMSR
jgi:hypothetical protein